MANALCVVRESEGQLPTNIQRMTNLSLTVGSTECCMYDVLCIMYQKKGNYGNF